MNQGIGRSRGHARHMPPYGTQFFRFHIHFHRKAPMLEVHAPLMGARPPTGNPGSATAGGEGVAETPIVSKGEIRRGEGEGGC